MQRHLVIAALALGFPLYALLARSNAESCPPSGCGPISLVLPDFLAQPPAIKGATR